MMSFRTKKLAKKSQVSLKGELLMGDAPELQNKLLGILDRKLPIQLDLEDTSEIDTACYQLLVQLKQECTAEGIAFSITKSSDAFDNVVRLFGMEEYFAKQ